MTWKSLEPKVLILVLASTCGCAKDPMGRVPPAFQLGTISESEAVLPALMEVIKPEGKSLLSVKTRQRIPCLARLTVADGGILPSALIAIFRDADARGGIANSLALNPVEKRGDTYTVGCTIRAPGPGRYRLIFQAIYPYAGPSGTGKARSKVGNRVVEITAAQIEVEPR